MRLVLITAAALSLACGLHATESEETPEAQAEREARVKANLTEHAERRAKQDSTKDEPRPETPTVTQDDPALLLPEYRVSSSRISELEIEIKKLNRDIERARKKLKPSDLDETLNRDDAPKVLAILGGKTAAQRKSVAAERVNLMEAERDILEAMKHVRTKKEEAELKEQLNAFKTMRRQLDDVLR
ncbi:MAG: hypothetical protein IT582_09905 [Opitutaceae bacterium]|nr:hypothetical protein [Opitutaceae bacterium]